MTRYEISLNKKPPFVPEPKKCSDMFIHDESTRVFPFFGRKICNECGMKKKKFVVFNMDNAVYKRSGLNRVAHLLCGECLIKIFHNFFPHGSGEEDLTTTYEPTTTYAPSD